MNQIKGLWRDTKYIWILLVVLAIVCSIFISMLYLFVLAGLPINYLYFAFVRYDKDGQPRIQDR